MTLVDSSVWVDHLRKGVPELVLALEAGEVLGHPHVVGELACGNLRHRSGVLKLLQQLPQVTVATDEEALACLEARRLHGRGLGWVDVHLLASALLTPCRLWTRDAALAAAAGHHGVAASPNR